VQQALSEGSVALRPGSLYAALGRLVGDGLIVETGDRPARELDDERRRCYRITLRGRQRLAGEVRRLERLVDHARSLALEPAPA
jgi:DNA-binding PadR family transcriptional regulator